MQEVWFKRPAILYGVSVALVLLVGFLDERTGHELSISILYLMPVALAARFGSRPAAVAIVLFATITWLAADLSARSFNDQGIVLWNGLVRFSVFLVIALILSRLRELVTRERELALTDALTGVANSRRFYEFLEYEKERLARTRRPLSLAFIDLDDFKTVNDKSGHLEGDRLLREVATTIRKKLRAVDLVARLGGDEFAVLLAETPRAEARLSLERIRDALNARMRERSWDITFSMGAVTADFAPTRLEDFVKSADDLMYEVKRAGKNRLLTRDYQE